jgi:creatinine amidohydrolase
MRSGRWQDLATTDFAGLDPERTVALLPVGAVEQHGPHLPLDTDSAIAAAIVARALPLVPDDLALLTLPLQAVGESTEHADFAGTLALEPETAIALWTEIGDSVARAGLRKLVLFNSHGGQTQIVDIVAQRLRRRHRMLVARASYFRFGVPDGLVPEAEIAHGIHGGALETSMMLAVDPARVRMDRAKDFVPLSRAMAERNALLAPDRPVGFGWLAQDLNPEGACGDATLATAEIGEQLLAHAAERLATLVRELADTPLATLRDRP